VAIPTAIPEAPFRRRFGIFEGITVVPQVYHQNSDGNLLYLFSMSATISSAILCMRASVYLIAAGLSPSIDPNYPGHRPADILMTIPVPFAPLHHIQKYRRGDGIYPELTNYPC